MQYKIHQPSNFLIDYVLEMVYIKDFYPEHTMDKFLPDGSINLVFELSNTPKYIFDNTTKEPFQECRDVWFSGVHKEFFTISAHAEEMMVVSFKPGSGFLLSQQSMENFTDKVIQANEVFGHSIAILHTNLVNAETPELKFELLENWLSDIIIPDDFHGNIIKFTLDYIQNSISELNLKVLAQKTGYSQKQFIQLFKKYVGITPKQYHRILRFNEILKSIESEKVLSWNDIIGQCGYFDQAHFIKDFQSFSGINPKQYVKDIGDYPNYLPVK